MNFLVLPNTVAQLPLSDNEKIKRGVTICMSEQYWDINHKTNTSQWCDTRLKGKLFQDTLSQNDVGFRTHKVISLVNTMLLIDPGYPIQS